MRFSIFEFFEYRLECLLNKWDSEGWQDYLALAGCVIGWTRGTGLMSANNIVAPGVENLGIRTFSTDEMAINLIGLLTECVENSKIENVVNYVTVLVVIIVKIIFIRSFLF